MDKKMDKEMKRKLGPCGGRSGFQEALRSNTSKPEVGTYWFQPTLGFRV